MYAEITAALEGFKAGRELLSAALKLNKQAEIVAAVQEANQRLGDALVNWIAGQERYATLLAETDDLKAEVKRLQDWEREKEAYEPKEIAPGVFAYTAKGEVKPLKSAMKLCANCFGGGKKSILQAFNPREFRDFGLECHSCRAKLTFHRYIDTP